MRRNTTPTHTLTVEGIDLTGANDVWVTYGSERSAVTIKDPTVAYDDETTTITVTLTEAQTSQLLGESVEVQVNYVLDGAHYATDIATVELGRNLLREAMLDA